MENIMTEEEEKKAILSSGLLKKRIELPKTETSPILCGGEPDILGFFLKVEKQRRAEEGLKKADKKG